MRAPTRLTAYALNRCFNLFTQNKYIKFMYNISKMINEYYWQILFKLDVRNKSYPTCSRFSGTTLVYRFSNNKDAVRLLQVGGVVGWLTRRFSNLRIASHMGFKSSQRQAAVSLTMKPYNHSSVLVCSRNSKSVSIS